MIYRFWFLILFVLFLQLLTGCSNSSQEKYRRFENRLETWRTRLNMPAISASIVKDKKIVWAKGFGYSDIENKTEATDKTIYHLASLTKPFASIILMQLVEQGKVNLNDPISKYGILLEDARGFGLDLASEDEIKVKHLLTHTAQGRPGSYYQYSGYLYGYLDQVIEKGSDKNFAGLIVNNITKPMQLNHTIPNIQDSVSFSYSGFDSASISVHCATPYIMDSLYNIVKGSMEGYFGTSAGLMSSAIDMASFSIAIENKKFLKPDTWETVFSPTISTEGDTLPYGYGWFIQDYKGLKIIWHYGFWNTNSSLIMMVPETGYNFVILANTNLLSRPFGLGGPDGNIFHSPFAIEFALTFLFDDAGIDIDFNLSDQSIKQKISKADKQSFEDLFILKLFALASAYNTIGEREYAEKAFNLYNDLFAKSPPEKFLPENLITEIINVSDIVHEIREFTIKEETEVMILSIGEGIGSDMYDFGWIENVTTGDTLWQMKIEDTIHAGGAEKNRLIDTSIKLDRGQYKLHFRSDDSHSFNRWNSTPPDFAFYGILSIVKYK